VVELALDDIQGNILRGYPFRTAVHLFLRIDDPGKAREFLRETEVTSAAEWKVECPITATNVALTYSGLSALGVDERILSALPAAFREPIRQRAARVLGDRGESAPETWEQNLGVPDAHILLMIARPYAPTDEEVRARYEPYGLEPLHCQRVADLPGRREHFGWADGLGQPAVEGVANARPGGGVPERFGEWRHLKAGEFIHGYPDEVGYVVSGPATPLLRNGSFMVYRKLEQNVVRFREKLYEAAHRYREVVGYEGSADELYELMAAKVVGRWRDGEPITSDPERRATDLGDKASDSPGTDFRYADDPDGLICPRGAHIRRANPRDTDGADGRAAARHRIIRRGKPYGEYVPRSRDDGTPGRGLVFICFNADFERQFETIQTRWCNDGNAFGLGDDRDYLLAGTEGSGKVTIPGRPPYFLQAQPDLVQTRGCEYLLMPGINALRDLAEPRFGFGRS
jgi:Dyp-type peroxidase family